MVEFKSVRDELKEFATTKQLVRLVRSFYDQQHCGSVIAIGNEWLFFRQYWNFMPNGFTTLRVKDVECIFSDEGGDRFAERILNSEGLLKIEDPTFKVDLRNTRVLLESLSKTGLNIEIECKYPEREEPDESDVGRILKINEDRLNFAFFDGTGAWSRAPASLKIDCVSRIQFHTAYLNTVSKYVVPLPHFA